MQTEVQNKGRIELFIRNLSLRTGEPQIKAFFEEFGKVSSVWLIRNRSNGRSRRRASIWIHPQGELSEIMRLRELILDGSHLSVRMLRQGAPVEDREHVPYRSTRLLY